MWFALLLLGTIAVVSGLLFIAGKSDHRSNQAERFKALCEEYCAVPVFTDFCVGCFGVLVNKEWFLTFYPCNIKDKVKHYDFLALKVCSKCRDNPGIQQQLSTSLRWLVDNRYLTFFAK